MSYALEFEFNVRYNIRRPVRIADVIDSLNGLSKLLPGVLPVLREYDRYNGPRGVVCNVKSIQEGSLKDKLSLEFVFKSEAAARKWIRRVKDKTGISTLERRFPTIAPIVNALILLGGVNLANRFIFPNDASSRDTIILHENAMAIIQTGSGTLGIPEERLRTLIEHEAQKVSIGKAACTFVKPAKTGNYIASIMLEDDSAESSVVSTLSPEIISAMPEVVEQPTSEVMTQVLERAELRIRACDIDYADKGWFAVVPAVSDKRLKLIMGEGVDRSRLALGIYQARVTLEYTVNDEGDRKYKSVTLNAILHE